MMRARGQMGSSEAAPQPGPHCKRFAQLLPLLFQEDLLDQEAQDTEALREHIAGCAYCRTMIAIYTNQEQVLRQSFAARIAASASNAEQITERLQEKPILSRVTHTVTLPAAMVGTPEREERRLEANQQLTAQSSRRHTHPLVGWLASVAAVLLIALLATMVFTRQRPVGTAAPTPAASPYVLAPGVDISLGVVSMVAPDEGWALADLSNTVLSATRQNVSTHHDSAILHYDGYQWRMQDFLPDVVLTNLSMTGAQEGWMLGVPEPVMKGNVGTPINGGFVPFFLLHYA